MGYLQPSYGIVDVLGGIATGLLTGGPTGAVAGGLGAIAAEAGGRSGDPCPYPSFYPNRLEMCRRAGYYNGTSMPTSPAPGTPITVGGPLVTYPGIAAAECPPGYYKIGDRCVSPGDMFPGGDPFIIPAEGTGTAQAPTNGAVNGNGMQYSARTGTAPPGYHWNKTSYYTKSKGWVQAGTKLVRNRRRNPANPRALDRAIGRVKSAKRLSKKLSRITIRDSKKCGCR